MKIGILSSIHWRTPPQQYGPWEYVTSLIAEGMVARGHQVTLFATGDSITKGNHQWICPHPLMQHPELEAKVYQYLHSALIFEHAHEFDVIHNHYDAYPLVFSKLIKTPVVTTIHGFSSEQVSKIYRRYNNTCYVSISFADRQYAPDINYIENVYHGIPIDDYQFTETPKDYFFYIGRISPDKGVHLSIQLALKLKFKFIIAGIIPSENKGYFEREIKPYLNDHISYIGEVTNDEKKELLRNAQGFLHLNTYPEGFGLTLIEAMACGTPVIGMYKGSISEVVEDTVTGFVVHTVDEAEQAIQRIQTISRRKCRERVEKYFTVNTMLDNYESVYKKILEKKASE